MGDIVIRSLRPDDSLEEITSLLHRAYKKNADMNIHFVASHQAPDVTQERLDQGTAYIAEQEGRIVGTITLTFPIGIPHAEYMTNNPLASFGHNSTSYRCTTPRRSINVGTLVHVPRMPYSPVSWVLTGSSFGWFSAIA